MTEIQAWIALALVALYIAGKAIAHVTERRRDCAEEGRYRAERLLEDGLRHVCDSVYDAYVKAAKPGVLTAEQTRDIIMRAETYAREELVFEGCQLDRLMSPRAVGRTLRAELGVYARKSKKEEV